MSLEFCEDPWPFDEFRWNSMQNVGAEGCPAIQQSVCRASFWKKIAWSRSNSWLDGHNEIRNASPLPTTSEGLAECIRSNVSFSISGEYFAGFEFLSALLVRGVCLLHAHLCVFLCVAGRFFLQKTGILIGKQIRLNPERAPMEGCRYSSTALL